MRKRLLGSLGALLVGAGLTYAQTAPAYRPATGFPFPAGPGMPQMPAVIPPSPAGPFVAPPQAPQVTNPNYVGNPTGFPGSRPVLAPQRMLPSEGLPQPVTILTQPIDQKPAESLPAPMEKQPADSAPLSSAPHEGVVIPADAMPSEGIPLEAYPSVFDKGCQEGCANEPRLWVNAEALYWIFHEGPLSAPLVSTGTPASGGIVSDPGSNILFGRTDGLDFEAMLGGRISAGYWLSHKLGVEVVGFALEEGEDRFSAVSDASGNPLLARPFINARTGLESALLVASPGAAAGSVAVEATSSLWGGEANVLLGAVRSNNCGVNLLAGFRYLELNEDITASQSTSLLTGGVAGLNGVQLGAPSILAITDTFDTRNQFYGGQFGFQAGVQHGKFFLGGTAKIGVGSTHQVVLISGNSSLIDPVGTVPGGLLAQQTNIGRRTNDVFTLVPQGELEVGCQVTKCITVTLGYSFLYWNKVARPGDQIDRLVDAVVIPTNPGFAPGLATAPRPAPIMTDREFWAQGLTAGIAIRY